jgi:Zn ribbon nucleic-acid-binding protein
MASKKRTPARRKTPEPFRVGTWNGLPNYECIRCGFKSLDREAALEHVLTRHAIQEAAQ